jgi:hypothetical protein
MFYKKIIHPNNFTIINQNLNLNSNSNSIFPNLLKILSKNFFYSLKKPKNPVNYYLSHLSTFKYYYYFKSPQKLKL